MGEISGVSSGDINNVDGFFTTQGTGGTATTAPTFTVSNSLGQVTITITNHSSYTNPNYQVSVSIAGSEIIADSAITHTLESAGDHVSNTMTFLDQNASTSDRTVSIKAQEFGANVQSAATTATYAAATFSSYRYYRIISLESGGSNSSKRMALAELRLFAGFNQGSTEYPTSAMTSNSGPSPYSVTGGEYSSSYAKWKIFDKSDSSWFWNLGATTSTNWVEFDNGTAVSVKSASLRFYKNFNDAVRIDIEGSNTGNFSGEEAQVLSLTSIPTGTGYETVNF